MLFCPAGRFPVEYGQSKQHTGILGSNPTYNLPRCTAFGRGAAACCGRKGNGRYLMKRTGQRKPGLAAKIAGISCASVVLAGCVGFGFASAGSGISPDAESFGIEEVSSANAADGASVEFAGAARDTAASTRLASAATRDISKGIAGIEAEEEAARQAEEAAKRAEEEAHIAAAQAARAAQLARDASAAVASLAEVDWTVGKDAFLAEWTSRIDAYLAGSSLAGYGSVFAQAAWDHGVDPRFSPAISNTESSKGANCFRSHNAWGWMGDTTWSSWEEAIDAHVAGLAEGYGYTISLANAQKYCPPTYEDWFNKTLSQMQQI